MSKADLWEAFEATWPAAETRQMAGWTLRDGRGGGKRVSAATGSGDISEAEAAMREMGQVPMFALRGSDPLDAELAGRGYALVDPVTIQSVPVEDLAGERAHKGLVYEVWPPLAIMTELWAEGGIGPARIDVMERVGCAKSGLLGRVASRGSAVGFVAAYGQHAFVHALEVAPSARRKGAGRALMHQAADWAKRQGATILSVAVTEANKGGNALYASLGMVPVDRYHYRVAKGDNANG